MIPGDQRRLGRHGPTCHDQAVILLLGGRDKGGGYANVLAEARGRVREVIAFGEAAMSSPRRCRQKLPCRGVTV